MLADTGNMSIIPCIPSFVSFYDSVIAVVVCQCKVLSADTVYNDDLNKTK